jgi:hypothetical protein
VLLMIRALSVLRRRRGWNHTGEVHPPGSLDAQVERLNLELDNLHINLWLAILDTWPYRRFS